MTPAPINVQVLVAGAPGIAAALNASGRFRRIIEVSATSEIRDLQAQGLLAQESPDTLVFLFSEHIATDVPGTTTTAIISKLTSAGWRVGVIEAGPQSRALTAENPAAGLLPAPFTTNNVLGALAGFGIPGIEPVTEAWGYTQIDALDPRSIAELTATPPAAMPAATGGWPTPPAGETTTAPAANPWPAAPAAADTPAAGWPAAPQAVPVDNPWPTPPAAPAPAPAADAADGNPWPTPPAAVAAAPATPETAWPTPPAVTQAPTPAAPSPWMVAGPDAAAPGENAWPTPPAPAAVDEYPDFTPNPAWTTGDTTEWIAGEQDGSDGPAPGAPTFPAPSPAPFAAPSDNPWPAPPAAAVAPSVPAPAAATGPDGNPWPAPPAVPAPQAMVPPAVVPTSTAPEATNWPAVQPGAAGPGPATETPSWGPAPEETGWATAGGLSPLNPPAGSLAPQSMERRGMVIPVTVAKGGAGKSTLTLNMAVYLALRLRSMGRTVCVVDANFQQPDIGKLINAYTPNIANLVQNLADLTPERIGTHMVHRNDLNTSFMLGPALTLQANPAWITPELYTHVIEVLRTQYDYIFVDTPVAEFHHDLFSKFVLPSADFMIVPVNPDMRTVDNADQWLKAITKTRHEGGMEFDPRRIGVVLNKAADDVSCSEDQVRVNLSNWIYLGAIPDSRAWQRAANEDEIVATQNFAQLNEAFSRILYAITGEEVLQAASIEPQSTGLVKKLFKRRKK